MMTQNLSLSIQNLECSQCENRIKDSVSQLRGIESIQFDSKKSKVKISFNPYKTSQKQIENKITELGYIIKKGMIQRWLDRLAESNEKQFGGKTLDCCSIKKN